jgi:catechol 2,3-dioxygenase-like lactoylglutathione lyase family enzyme
MAFTAIDHGLFPVSSSATAEALARLGLTVTAERPSALLDARIRTFTVGSGPDRFVMELLAPGGGTARPEAAPFQAVLTPPDRLAGLVLRVPDAAAVPSGLTPEMDITVPAGDRSLRLALLPAHDLAVVRLLVLAGDLPAAPSAPAPEGGLALKRLDHLAAMTADLEASTRHWVEVLGVPLYGEVTSPTIIIRQFKIGDAILELLGPASPDSPAAGRPPGLASMIACEVDDLEAAVAQARTAGFTAPEPATGVLPGTRVATIPAAELGGLALQLISYR